MADVWYEAGLRFACQPDCGQCCAGPQEGYVFVTRAELRTIARTLGWSQARARRQLTHAETPGGRLTLRERPEGGCVFLEGKRCTIYDVRPAQCRTFPWWPENLESPAAWARTGRSCPGVGQGELVAPADIKLRSRPAR